MMLELSCCCFLLVPDYYTIFNVFYLNHGVFTLGCLPRVYPGDLFKSMVGLFWMIINGRVITGRVFHGYILDLWK